MKQLFYFSIIFVFLFISNASAVLLNASEGANVAACSSTGTMFSAGANSCRTTPSKYQITIYEMGVCKSHPFGVSGTEKSMDTSTCSVTFSNSSGSTVDIANNIGGKVDLDGTSTRPSNGTYKFPYIILDKNFIINAEFLHSNGNTYYGSGNGNTATLASSSVDYTDQLTNFNGPACYSGYVGASIPVGTIDAFLVNNSMTRSEDSEVTSGECDNVSKLVGVISLSNPFSITPKTVSLQFNFKITNYGVQFTDDVGNDVPDTSGGIGSGPFSGSFLIKDSD